MTPVEEAMWMCGAWQPAIKTLEAFRCTLPAGHGGATHQAEIDGRLVAEWPRDQP